MNNFKKIIKLILNCLTIILVMILVLVIYSKLSLTFFHKKYPSYFGYTLFEVASGSMSPTLNINDVILVKITQDNLKENDIIAFQDEDTIITHRILYIDGDTLTVKGDSNNIADRPINIDQIIGKVVKIYPKLGIWKKVVMEPKILIAIFITLLLFDFAISYKSNDSKKEKRIKNKPKKSKIKNEVKVEKIEIKEKKQEKKENEKLLELTRKIDIEDINKLLEEAKIENVLEEPNEIDEPKKVDNEQLDYTIRLDLNEIQKRIDKKIR